MSEAWGSSKSTPGPGSSNSSPEKEGDDPSKGRRRSSAPTSGVGPRTISKSGGLGVAFAAVKFKEGSRNVKKNYGRQQKEMMQAESADTQHFKDLAVELGAGSACLLAGGNSSPRSTMNGMSPRSMSSSPNKYPGKLKPSRSYNSFDTATPRSDPSRRKPGSSRFHDLLHQLADEHEHLLGELRSEGASTSLGMPRLSRKSSPRSPGLPLWTTNPEDYASEAAFSSEGPDGALDILGRKASADLNGCVTPIAPRAPKMGFRTSSSMVGLEEPSAPIVPGAVEDSEEVVEIMERKASKTSNNSQTSNISQVDSMQGMGMAAKRSGTLDSDSSMMSKDTDDEDGVYRAHSRWVPDRKKKRAATTIVGGKSVSSVGLDRESTTSGETPQGGTVERIGDYDGFLKRFIGLPSSPRRVSWDIVGAVLILYDLFAIPLKLFEPPDNAWTEFMDWFALIFWTVNMYASITVAYIPRNSDRYEMNPKRILAQYLKFWFWVDLAVVAPDWIFTFVALLMGGSDGAGDNVKLLRVLRLMRCMRLLRLTKLKWIMASIKDLIDSESIDIFVNIFKMIAMLIAVNHFVACAWFATTLGEGDGPTWVNSSQNWASSGGEFEHAEWSYKYITSFHWAITQFTPSSMHVQPQNMVERTFAITVVVFGLVGFSYLVGSITGSLTELRRMKEEYVKQFWNLRRFLKKTGVPIALRVRIEKYLEHAWEVQKSAVTNTNLPILKLLTEQLRNELNCAMSLPHFEVHPLFKYLSEHSSSTLQRIATKALSRKLLARKEVNFYPGEIAPALSFLVAGQLLYFQSIGSSGKADESTFEKVDHGEDWVTEPALWLAEWMTLGRLVASSVSELLDVSSAEFAESIKRTPQVYDRVSIYAQNFVVWLNQRRADNNLSDIGQKEEIEDEVEAMLYDQDDEDDSHSLELMTARHKRTKHHLRGSHGRTGVLG